MKKWYAWLMILCFAFGAARAEEKIRCSYGEITLGEAQYSIWIEENNQESTLIFSAMPEWRIKTHHTVSTPEENALSLEWIAKTPWESLISDWMQVLNAKEEAGVFTGDLVDSAKNRKRASFGWTDLIYLSDRIEEKAGQEGKAFPFPLFRELLGTAARTAPEIRFSICQYEDERVWTVTADREGKTIATLSVRQEDNHVHFVLGYAENGKTYYRERYLSGNLEAGFALNGTDYADDRGSGFRTMGKNQVIARSESRLSPKDKEEASFTSETFFGSEGELKTRAELSFRRESLKAEFFLNEGKDPFLSFRLETGLTGFSSRPEAEKAIDLDQADDPSATEFNADLERALTEEIPHLIQAIPSELMTYLLPLLL